MGRSVECTTRVWYWSSLPQKQLFPCSEPNSPRTLCDDAVGFWLQKMTRLGGLTTFISSVCLRLSAPREPGVQRRPRRGAVLSLWALTSKRSM